jgi:hypothetical protein
MSLLRHMRLYVVMVKWQFKKWKTPNIQVTKIQKYDTFNTFFKFLLLLPKIPFYQTNLKKSLTDWPD